MHSSPAHFLFFLIVAIVRVYARVASRIAVQCARCDKMRDFTALQRG
jgi:hypothetical protein